MSSDVVDVAMVRANHAQALVPRLRFPEFRDAGHWEQRPLGTFAELIDERVGDRPFTPLSITSGIGLVSQEEKFGRTIAGQQLRNYLVLRKGDFAYNKSATKLYPQGYAVMYHGGEPGCVPGSIFTCFRATDKSICNEFIDYLLAANLHGRWLSRFTTTGARANGSLNVNDDDLLALPVPLPSGVSKLAEQRNIADCLSTLDAVIAAEEERLVALREQKKGLLQALFPADGQTTPLLRFPEFRNAGDWDSRTLAEVTEMRAGKFIPASDIAGFREEGSFPCFGGNGLRGYTSTYTHTGKYPLVGRQGALCGNVNLASGSFYATEHAVVAKARDGVFVDWLYHLLVRFDLNRFKTGQAQPGLSVEVINRLPCLVPSEIEEQRRIADCLSSLDELIVVESQRLATLKTHKAGLMQQLFPASTEAVA